MKILYVSQYYPPEIGAPSARVSELAERWSQSGHEVTVLTGFPNHPTGEVHPDYLKRWRRLFFREKVAGVDVVRTWLAPFPNRKPLERILNYTSFCVSAAFRGIFLRKPEVVIGTSPQLLVALAAWFIARVKRAPVIFEVRDIWPEGIIASGVGGENSTLAKALRKISVFLYKRCDLVVVVSPAFKTELVTKYGVDPSKIEIVMNGVETDLFSPEGDPAADAETLGFDPRFLVSYIGTVGFAHGLGTLLDVAEVLREEMPDVQFLVLGEGAEKESLEVAALARGLDNVRFISQRPREQIPAILRSSEICLVLLKRTNVFKTVIPTKMLEFMACGRALIVGVDGQAREIVEEADAGVFAEPEDAAALVGAIRALHGNSDERRRLGGNGRGYIVDRMSRAATADRYLEVLTRIREDG